MLFHSDANTLTLPLMGVTIFDFGVSSKLCIAGVLLGLCKYLVNSIIILVSVKKVIPMQVSYKLAFSDAMLAM